MCFVTQKTMKARNEFEKDFYGLFNNAFYGKTMASVRNRLRLEIFQKDDTRNIIEQQSKLTFNGFHKTYDNCDIHFYGKNEVLFDKSLYLGFTVLELSK